MKQNKYLVLLVIGIGMSKISLSMQITYSTSGDSHIAQAAREFAQNPLALHEACRNGDLEAVKRLIVLPEKINTQDGNGWTPLQLVALYETNTTILQLLLNSGARAHVQNKHRLTPLHIAADLNKFQHLKTLLFHDYHTPDNWQPPQRSTQREMLSLKNICLDTLASKKLERKRLEHILPAHLWQDVVTTRKKRKLMYMKYLLMIQDCLHETVRHKVNLNTHATTLVNKVLAATTLDDLKELGYEDEI